MDSPRRRPPLAHVPAPVRVAMALGGLVVGLLLVFVGARSCEESLEDPAPTPLTTTEPAPSGN